MQQEQRDASSNTWERILGRVQARVGAIAFGNWFEPTKFVSLENEVLRLTVPDSAVRSWLLAEYDSLILAAARPEGATALEIEVEERSVQPSPPKPLAPYRHTRRSAASEALWDPKRSRAANLAFLHSYFAQVGLPRSLKAIKNADGTFKTRYLHRAGNCALLVRAGEIAVDGEFVLQPLPYGPKPRLMFADICTRAIQTRSPEVDMEESVRQYLERRLGLSWGGGNRGQYTLFRKQSLALAACSLVLAVEQDKRVIQFQGAPIARFDAWVGNEGSQRALWPGSLRLTAEFFGSLLDHGLPIQREAYWALSGSPLAMDVYVFLAHRLWRVDGYVDIPWRRMRDAMGPEYRSVKKFRDDFLAAVKAVEKVYPDAQGRIEAPRGRCRLRHAPPPVVPFSPSRRRRNPKG